MAAITERRTERGWDAYQRQLEQTRTICTFIGYTLPVEDGAVNELVEAAQRIGRRPDTDQSATGPVVIDGEPDLVSDDDPWAHLRPEPAGGNGGYEKAIRAFAL